MYGSRVELYRWVGCMSKGSRLRNLAPRPRHHAGQKGRRETRKRRISSYLFFFISNLHLFATLQFPAPTTYPFVRPFLARQSIITTTATYRTSTALQQLLPLSTHAWSHSPSSNTFIHHVHLRSRQHCHAQHSLAQPAHLGRYHQDPGSHQL